MYRVGRDSMSKDTELNDALEALNRVEYESQKLLDAASAVLNSESFPAAAKAGVPGFP